MSMSVLQYVSVSIHSFGLFIVMIIYWRCVKTSTIYGGHCQMFWRICQILMLTEMGIVHRCFVPKSGIPVSFYENRRCYHRQKYAVIRFWMWSKQRFLYMHDQPRRAWSAPVGPQFATKTSIPKRFIGEKNVLSHQKMLLPRWRNKNPYPTN